MLQEGTRIEHEMQNAKRLTSGIMVANGQFCVNKVRDIINKRDMDRQEKEMARARKARRELKKQRAAIKKIRLEKGDNIKTWNAKECKIFLQYKKVEGDSAMPSKIDDLRARCELIAHRRLPVPSLHSSDDEGDDEASNEDPPQEAPFLAMLAAVSESVEA